MCYNASTKVVTFPGTLKCPKGTRPLELGAEGQPGQDGADGFDGRTGPMGPAGPQGPQGPQGSPGANANTFNWFGTVGSRDIAGNAGVSSFADLRKTIMATITAANLSGGGHYVLAAELSGIWAPQSRTGAYIYCYFQDAVEYPNGKIAFGGATATNNSWTGINLRVTGYPSDFGLAKSALHLVCATDGVISGLTGYLNATASTSLKNMNQTAPGA